MMKYWVVQGTDQAYEIIGRIGQRPEDAICEAPEELGLDDGDLVIIKTNSQTGEKYAQINQIKRGEKQEASASFEAANSYKKFRANEYPPLTDLADALVHNANGDSTQLDAYVAACNAVKAKYPKPQ